MTLFPISNINFLLPYDLFPVCFIHAIDAAIFGQFELTLTDYIKMFNIGLYTVYDAIRSVNKYSANV